MKTMSTLAVAAALTIGLAASASAQSSAPTIPNPANPTPTNPIATDGSSLLGLQTGRSVAVFPPIGGYIGAAVH